MTLKTFRNIVLYSFHHIDVNPLSYLMEGVFYSDLVKKEVIYEMGKLFETLKAKGVKRLVSKPSECKVCYPGTKAYEFYDAETNEFIARYLIDNGKDVEFVSYTFEECRNVYIPKRKGELPF